MPSVYAVHISNSVLSNPVWLTGYACAWLLVGFSAWRIREEEIPRVGVLTAAFFVASQIHVPLGVTTAHLILNGLVGVILGRRAAVAIAVGLFLQALLLVHGGIDALGVNVLICSVPAELAGLTFRPVRRLGLLSDFPLGVVFGAATASATLALNFAALMYGGQEDWSALAWVSLSLNLPLIAVEGFAVGFAVHYLGKAKPEWLA